VEVVDEVEQSVYRKFFLEVCIHDKAVKGNRHPETYARKWQKTTTAEETQKYSPRSGLGLAENVIDPLET